MTHKIYGLADPADNRIRYVGKTKNTLSHRRSEHITYAKRKKGLNPRTVWINEVLARGVKPEIVLLEKCAKENWRERERHWASLYKDLVNSKRAGGGNDGERANLADISRVINRMGKEADAVLAEEIGITRKAISYHRKQLGIPASFNRARNKPPPWKPGFNKIKLPQEIIDNLGKEPDYLLARKAGVEKSSIARRRKKAGIPSYAQATGNNGQIKYGVDKRQKLKSKACVICAAVYNPTGCKQRTCSEECSHTLKMNYQREWRANVRSANRSA